MSTSHLPTSPIPDDPAVAPHILAATSTPIPAARPSQLVSFLRFGGLSGLGWLLDFGILFALVRWAHLPVFTANLLSATTAAVTVFLLSRKLVFRGQTEFVLVRTLLYAAYTLVVIVLASVAMKYLASTTVRLSLRWNHPLALSTAALLAKVIVTPANFLLNFVVARFTSEHARTPTA